LSWHDIQHDAPVTVPATAKYHVGTTYPYNYKLHLRSGYKRTSLSSDEIIGYFEASPEYPWWYFVDVFGLKHSEILVLHESYRVTHRTRDDELLQTTKDAAVFVIASSN